MSDHENQEQSYGNTTPAPAFAQASSGSTYQDEYVPEPHLVAPYYDLGSDEVNNFAHQVFTDSTVALVQATELEHQQATGEATQQAADTTTDPAQKEAPVAPTSLQSSLAQIQITADRQERFVMLGDPAVEKRFYDNLLAAGKMEMRGRTPVIALDQRDSLKWYQEAARQVAGENSDLQAVSALRLTLPRDGSEIGWAGLKNSIKNKLGRQHEIMIVVAGSTAERAEKLKELGALVAALQAKGALSKEPPNDQLVNPATGQLNLPEGGKELHLQGTKGLVDLVSQVSAVTDAFKRAEQAKDQARKEARNEREEKSNAETAGKGGEKQAGAATGAQAGADGKPVPVNKFAAELASSINTTLADPSSWKVRSPDAKGNTRDPVELRLMVARKLKVEEFATLPVEAREKMLVEAAVLIRKIDDGQVSKAAANVLNDPPKYGGPAARDVLEQLFIAERQGNPELLSNLERRITEMQQSGALANDPQLAKFGEEVRATREAVQEERYSPLELSAQRPEQNYSQAYESVPPVSTASYEAASPSGPVSSIYSADPITKSPFAVQLEAVAQRAPSEVSVGEMTEVLNGIKGAPAFELIDGRHTEDVARTLTRIEGFVAAAADGHFGEVNKVLATELATEKLPRMRWSVEDTFEHTIEKPSGELAVIEATRVAEAHWHAGFERAAGSAEAPVATPVEAPTAAASKLHQKRYFDDPYGIEAPAKPAATPDVAPAPSAEPGSKAAESVEVMPNKLEAAPVEAPSKAVESVTAESPAKPLEAAEVVASKPAGEATAESPMKAPEAVLADAAKATQEATGAAPAKVQDSGEAVASKPAVEVTAESPVKAPEAVLAGNAKEAQMPTAESAPAIPKEAAPVVVSAQAQQDTETAVLRLSGTLKNPAGLLTTQDKQWDQKGIDRTAKAITRLDAGAVAAMSPDERTKVHAVAQWVADNAAAGKLPGFASEKGQELLAKVQSKVAELAPLAEGSLDDAARKQLGKADAVVSTMDARERGITERLSPTPAARPEADVAERNPGVDRTQTARALVDAVYSGQEVSEAYAKYLLKEGSQLSAADIKSLDPDTRARATVALDQLSQAVKGGALGEFDTLSAAVQRHTNGASAAADKLFDAYKADKEMQAPLARATMALSSEREEANKDAAQAPAKDASKAKSAEMER